jgi:hypothetical protein
VAGDQSLRLGEPATFALSLVNGGRQRCVIAIDARNFGVKIYSGRDRIWSTRDCARIVPPISTTLKSGQALDWQLTWDGQRSRAECKRDSEPLGSGTYIVTAHFAGAKPVQLRMVMS